MNFVKVEDVNIRHIWKCEDEECDATVKTVIVDPTFYQDNGTPVCQCDMDMVYSHTEVHIETRNIL